MKMQATDWKIFTTHITGKEDIFRIYTGLLQIEFLKNRKMRWDLNVLFTKAEIQETNKHMRRFSSSLFIRKKLIKIIMKYHHILG